MQYLRKIDIKRWYNQPEGDSDSVSDLGTTNHELSVWEVEDDSSDLDDMALALALTRNTPEEICCILLRSEEIETGHGFRVRIEAQDGDTGYESVKGRHKNFMICTLEEMGVMASYIHQLIKAEKADRIRIYTEQDLLLMLAGKMKSGHIDAERLRGNKNKWRKEAQKIIDEEIRKKALL